jgi:hypothetical protein
MLAEFSNQCRKTIPPITKQTYQEVNVKKILVLMLLCAVPALASAQAPTIIQQEEMKKMSFLIGNWKGEGWMVTPDGKRHTFRQTERIQSKLGGLAILIEGEGKRMEDDQTFFQSLAIMNYDEKNKRYRFIAHTNLGPYSDSEAKLIEGGMEWDFRIPQVGRIRYTIKLTEKGDWFEIGEFSSDEKSWQKFLEMTLKRVN